MKKIIAIGLIGVALVTNSATANAKEWSLQECIAYALQNNISLQKSNLSRLNAKEDILLSKAQLFPSLSASTNQMANYTPWVESGISSDGYARSSVDKVYYNGSYGVNANWTVWNGNRNTNTVKLNKLVEQKAAIDSATTANNIQEKIAQLYVQILYSNEAIKVNKESLKSSIQNEERGKDMLKVGKMSKADLAQLTAQRAQDEYNVINAESTTRNFKRQLKQLLQITDEEEFEVTPSMPTNEMAMQPIPALNNVYTLALASRPEIKAYQNSIEQSNLQIKLAKAQKLPTIGVNASVGTNTTSMNNNKWGEQLKTNFNAGAGVSISIPLFDQRSKKTALNKANIQKESAILDLKNEQTNLWATIEEYWLQATTNQNRYRSAQESTKSAKESYELLSEQFKLGLKNIVELRNGKEKLLQAEQSELESKYMTILNINMLNFYQNGTLR
ncbi:MAG: TolC family protein [Prevotella sp.]|nr:TolC family protein [Prevotella sp.]